MVFLVGLVLTLWAWRLAIQHQLSEQRADLHHDAAQIGVAVTERLVQYVTLERSGQALFAVLPSVTAHQWRAFVESLRVETNFPGLIGLAFIAHVPHPELTGFLAQTRADDAPDFGVRPDGGRDTYCVVQYVEPMAQNAGALGFDSCTVPASRTAMEQARDRGRPVLTGSVQLPWESAERSTVILYAPVYRSRAPVRTVEERRAALRGWIGAPILIETVLEGVIPEGSTLDLQVFDGNRISLKTLLYDHGKTLARPDAASDLQSGSSDRLLFPTTLEFGGHLWTLHFSRALTIGGAALVVAGSGVLISLLLSIAVWSLARTKAHAQVLAKKMTDALRDSENGIRALYEVISKTGRSPQEKVQALLAMGCRRLGLTTGILARIEGERCEVVTAVPPGGEFAKGDTYQLDETYCRDTLAAQGPFGVEHISATPLRMHPCHAKFGVEAYLGAPVLVRGRVYGTLSFSSRIPRPTPFTAMDREVLQLMAQWVGGVIEQELMEEEARNRQEMLIHASRLSTLGEMASGLAHELNQPLTSIVNFTEACITRLRAGLLDRERSLATLEKIAAQSIRAGEIIRHMRSFVRKGETQRAVIEVADIIGEIRDFVAMEARRCSIDIDYALEPGLPPVLADRVQVQQVILNLIRNAIEAMDDQAPPRTITVRALRQDESTAEIAIEDTGPGLSAETAKRVPEPFFTTKPDGLGLGLCISQSIVEVHGGRLWATPNSGPGVTFHFTLPTAGEKVRRVH